MQKQFGYFILVSLLALPAVFFFGCNEEEKPEHPVLNHKNAVEYYVTTTRENNLLVVTTKKDIYSNYKLLSTTIVKDTLPDLGTESVTDEDENGNEIHKNEPVAYDIYFHSERK